MMSEDFSPCSKYFCKGVQSSLTILVNSRSAIILLILLMVYFSRTVAELLSSLLTVILVVHWTACSLTVT